MIYNETTGAWNFSKERFLIVQLFEIKDTEGGGVGKRKRTSGRGRGTREDKEINMTINYICIKCHDKACYYV